MGSTTGYLTQTGRQKEVPLWQADATADTVAKQAAAAIKATWTLVLASCCVLWIDNWYRAQNTGPVANLYYNCSTSTETETHVLGTTSSH